MYCSLSLGAPKSVGLGQGMTSLEQPADAVRRFCPTSRTSGQSVLANVTIGGTAVAYFPDVYILVWLGATYSDVNGPRFAPNLVGIPILSVAVSAGATSFALVGRQTVAPVVSGVPFNFTVVGGNIPANAQFTLFGAPVRSWIRLGAYTNPGYEIAIQSRWNKPTAVAQFIIEAPATVEPGCEIGIQVGSNAISFLLSYVAARYHHLLSRCLLRCFAMSYARGFMCGQLGSSAITWCFFPLTIFPPLLGRLSSRLLGATSTT